MRDFWTLSFLVLVLGTVAPSWGQTPQRPPIVSVAEFAVKVSNMDVARQFYSGVLGLEEAFTIKQPGGGGDLTTFKINDKQYVYVSPELTDPEASRLLFVSYETTDARALRDFLAAHDVEIPAQVTPDPEGNLSFMVHDPEGNHVRFIQFEPNSLHGRNNGKFLSDHRTSDHAIHVGYWVKDRAKLDAFYGDLLGFRLLWEGGMRDDRMQWISMMVPDGNTWVEYMVEENPPSVRQRGVLDHLALETMDMEKVHQTIVGRGYTDAKPAVGRDGRWLMHLYDKDLTRTEYMVRKPVQTPCCSPLRDIE